MGRGLFPLVGKAVYSRHFGKNGFGRRRLMTFLGLILVGMLVAIEFNTGSSGLRII
jgi:hypothetical protein